MNLKHLNDKTLLSEIKKLVSQELSLTVEVLQHLREIDKRKLYSDLKCSSLFDYCVRELGFSEASAQRRIIASRLIDDIPDLIEKIEKGKLTLTNISQANQFFRENEIKNPEQKNEILNAIEGLSKKGCEEKLLGMGFKNKPRPSYNITISEETHSQLQHLQALIGKNLSMDELLLIMVKTTKENIEKKKFKLTDRPRGLSPVKVGRTVPASIKRHVYERDQKCVQCGSTYNLNFDHREAFALGGETSIENIRLLCFNCNQRSRIRMGLTSPQSSP